MVVGSEQGKKGMMTTLKAIKNAKCTVPKTNDGVTWIGFIPHAAMPIHIVHIFGFWHMLRFWSFPLLKKRREQVYNWDGLGWLIGHKLLPPLHNSRKKLFCYGVSRKHACSSFMSILPSCVVPTTDVQHKLICKNVELKNKECFIHIHWN